MVFETVVADRADVGRVEIAGKPERGGHRLQIEEDVGEKFGGFGQAFGGEFLDLDVHRMGAQGPRKCRRTVWVGVGSRGVGKTQTAKSLARADVVAAGAASVPRNGLRAADLSEKDASGDA
jgi:ATP-dependent Clp protease ATP-binding subunit ClpA